MCTIGKYLQNDRTMPAMKVKNLPRNFKLKSHTDAGTMSGDLILEGTFTNFMQTL
jgi:hypothetical protein